MTSRHRPHRKTDCSYPGPSSALLTLTARVRTVDLTPCGHLVCVLDTRAGRLKALSDAAGVHQPELAVGSQVQVSLLRLKRVREDAIKWQLPGCRGVEEKGVRAQAELEGSAA